MNGCRLSEANAAQACASNTAKGPRGSTGIALSSCAIIRMAILSQGVAVTVIWEIKPELAGTFVETLRRMFPETRLHKGFRNIRLLRSDADPNQFVLIEEWDEVQDFRLDLPNLKVR
jgi:Antibiotic biosynthesis monooxygenase